MLLLRGSVFAVTIPYQVLIPFESCGGQLTKISSVDIVGD